MTDSRYQQKNDHDIIAGRGWGRAWGTLSGVVNLHHQHDVYD